jgi:hypothetical protein
MDLPPFLTAHDRCDACGQQAYIEIGTKPVPLRFCYHHWKQHKEAIDAAEIEVTIDELHKVGAER